MLLKAGACLDIKDILGCTILDYAKRYKEEYPETFQIISEWDQKFVEISEDESFDESDDNNTQELSTSYSLEESNSDESDGCIVLKQKGSS